MGKKVIIIRSKTYNGRTAHTRVFLPNGGMVAVTQRVLATPEDISSGWFPNYNRVIRKTKNYIVVENEVVYWNKSFEAIMDAYNFLTGKIK